MRNSGSGVSGDAVAPTAAVLRVITPAAGDFNVAVLAAPASGPSRVKRASIWPAVTRSPSLAKISVTLMPGASSVTTASSRGTRKPVTRMDEEKQPFVARTTATCGTGCELGSAYAGIVTAKPTATRKAALAAVIITGTKTSIVTPGFRATLHRLVRGRLAAASPPIQLRQLPYHPKSVRDIANVGIVSEARHRAQILGLAVECAATQNAQAALAARPCRAVVRCAAIIVVPAIFDPFGRIASRVIKTECVRFVRTDGSRLLNVGGAALPAIRLTRADVAAPPVRSVRSAPGGVLPLGFGRKPIGFARLLRQPGHERLGVEPADIDNWTVAATPVAILRSILAPSLLHALVPLAERHLVAPDGERLADAHAMHGVLVLGCRAHVEGAGGHDDELSAIRAIAEYVSSLEIARRRLGRWGGRGNLRPCGGCRSGGRRWGDRRGRRGGRRQRARAAEIEFLEQ